MQFTNISEAKASLSFLIKTAQETNQPVIIGKTGEPVAVLSAYKQNDPPRQLEGTREGKVRISSDVDDVNKETSTTFYTSTLFPKEI